MESLYYHLTVQVQRKKFYMLTMSGCLATATVIASITKKKGIDNRNTHMYIFA